jgi:hypothetical protein
MCQKRGEKMVVIRELKTCHLLEIFFVLRVFVPISGRIGTETRLHIAAGGWINAA